MEERLVAYLKAHQMHIVSAESCTGGMIASSIVEVAGASEVFNEGYVTYSNEAKNKILGVSFDTIEQYNVVSKEVVAEMAVGAARVSGAEVAVATTGLAGPGGGSQEIPVGTVWVGCSIKETVYTKRLRLDGSRKEIRQDATNQAVSFVLECLENN